MNTYTPSEFDLRAQAACARRELAYRRKVYERRILNGTMSSRDADREIACMEAIVLTLTKLIEDMEGRLQPGLFERIAPPAVNPPNA